MILRSVSALGIFVGLARAMDANLGNRFTHMLGIDVNSDTGPLDWQSLAAEGTVFAWIHATEGNSMSHIIRICACEFLFNDIFEVIPIHNSPNSMPVLSVPISSAVHTILPDRTYPQDRIRLNCSSTSRTRMMVLGSETTPRCLLPSNLWVRSLSLMFYLLCTICYRTGGDDESGFCYGLSAEDLAVWQTDFYGYYKNVVGRTVSEFIVSTRLDSSN